MPDLYTTNAWVATTVYSKNDFVSNGGYTYYALVNHTSTSNFNNDVTNGYWGGVLDINGSKKPYFFWKASYGYNFNIKPSVRSISFGEGYKQDISDGINNILLPFDVQFNDRTLDEYTAILHFLNARAGYQKFYFIPPAPFNLTKLFICSEWQPTQTFYNKYSISCKFEERI